MQRFIWLLVLGLACGAVGRATTVVPLSVEELTSAAEMVVEARAVQSWSAWNPQRTVIYTYTRLAVDKTLKGSAGAELLVKQPGGTVGAYGQAVPGVRQFQDGEDVVLFLRHSIDGDAALSVVGLMQGSFRRLWGDQGEASVSNGVPGVTAVTKGNLRSYSGTALSLQSLESRVQKAVAK